MANLFGPTQYGIGFEEFWEIYPRKVCKAAAHRAYLKALRTNKHEHILESLKRARVGWMGREEKHIPHASTWLNAEDHTMTEVKERPTIAGIAQDDLWRFRMGLKGNNKLYRAGGFWNSTWGSRPEHGGTDVPPAVLAEWRSRS